MPDEIWWPALCGNRTIQDAFWITNLTVNTPNPDVTRCFQNTVMIWVPSGCLWLMAPFYIKHLRGRETVRSTWASKSLLNIMKLIICLLLCLTDVLDLAKAIHEASWGQGPPVVFYIAPSVQLITFMLAGVFAHWEYKKGIHSSGPLFWFWSLVLVCSGVTMYSKIFNNHYQSDSEEIFRFVVYCPHVLLVFIQWILTIIVDYKVFPPQKTRLSRANDVIGEKTPLLQKMGRKDDQPMLEESPEIRCSFLSNVTYFWYAKVLKMGLKKSLEFEDLNDILPRDKCQNILPTFTREWQKETEKCRRESKENKRNSQEDSGFVPTESQKEGKRKHRTPSLLKVMWRSLGWYLFLAAVYRFVCVFIILINPLLLRVLLNIIHDKNSQGWHGYVIAVMMCLSSEIHVIAIQRFCHHSMNLGLRLRTAVTAAVYRKALRLSSAAKRQTTVGQIVNMLAVDAQKLQDAPIDLQELWTLPLVCILTTLLLWDIVGPASISGVALLILFIVPVNGIYVANKIAKLQLVQMDKKDHRVKVTNEILSGIKVLKLYAWEPSFKAKVFGIREEELKYLKYANYLSAVSTVFFICSTYLATCLIFAVYVPLIGHNVLDASTAFVTMSLVNILSFPLSVLPFSVMFVAQCWVSVKRIRDFLLLEEVGADTVVYDHNAEYAAEIKNGTFSWGKDDYPLLNNMDMQVEPGSLVAIVGPVGSGKSSLVSALIGEMWKIGGKVTLNGSLAYVPQIAWIQNETVKGNILFGKPYNTDRYEEVLDACALKPDLAILAGGDLTEIGEKISVRTSNGAHLIFKAVHFVDFLSKLEGINLSGGQKQRVSLARAVYQDEDIYLLDDPLSAVDAHVGKHLFDQVIGPHGLLKSKTRILVTHSITYLPNVDQIFVMKNGHISERGSYEELISHNGAFAEFLRDYISDTLEESGEEKADLADIIGKLGTLIEDETEGDNIPDNKTDQLRLRRMKSRKGSSDGGTTFTPDRALSYTEQSEYAQLVTVEDEAEGTIKMSVLKKFFKATGWTAVVGAIFFHLLYLVAMVSTNIWLSMWTSDPVINGTRTDQERNYRLSVYGILTLGQVVMILIASMSLAIGSVYVSRTMHTDLIAGILRAPMSFFDTTPVGRIMNRVSKDMEGLDFNVPFLLRWWFNNVVRVLGTIVIIAYSTPIFMVAFVPLAAVYVLMQWVYTRTVRQLRRVDAVRRSPVFVHFDESIVGATSIRAYKQEERFTARCDQLIDESQRAWYYIILSMRWLGFVGESFGSIIMFFACLFAVMERDTIGSSLAGLSVSYSLQICVYLSLYVRCCTELETSLVSVERINEYSEVPTEAAWEVEGACPEQWPDEGNVQYDKYSTRYRPGLDYVLQGITVNIKPKEKVGVVGRTGAGKSSMALSLFRIIEAAEGKISVDGVDISQLGLSDLRSRITVIPQDPVIFSGTLRMNLDPFQRYSDDMLWDALAHAYLKNFVQTVPGGLSYECGENGEALSVGQRQLVCLARALLRKSKILVLDEATAGVDLETDSLIQDTIREAFKDCTILTIAHRLNTILDYDRVIVMDQGKIVEFDSPTRLIEDQSTIFYAMAKDANLV